MECFNCGSLPRRASRTLKQLRFDLCGSCEEATLLPTRETGQYVRGHLPGARSRPRIHIRHCVDVMQERRLEPQESDDLRA